MLIAPPWVCPRPTLAVGRLCRARGTPWYGPWSCAAGGPYDHLWCRLNFGVARKGWRLEAADEPGWGSRSETLRTEERVRGARPAFDRRNLRYEPGHRATRRRRCWQECVAGVLVPPSDRLAHRECRWCGIGD